MPKYVTDKKFKEALDLILKIHGGVFKALRELELKDIEINKRIKKCETNTSVKKNSKST